MITKALATLEQDRKRDLEKLNQHKAYATQLEGLNAEEQAKYQKQLDEALPLIQRAVSEGYVVATQLEHDEWLVPLRDHDGYKELKRQAEQRQSQARDAFKRAGGPSLLRSVTSH